MTNFIARNGLFSILNESIGDVVLYYSQKEKDFIPVMSDEDVPDDYIELPYRGLIEKAAKREFRKLLSDEERALADSFSEKHGFFQFIEEVGLIARYDEAFERIAYQVMHDWEKDNDIKLDWNEILAI